MDLQVWLTFRGQTTKVHTLLRLCIEADRSVAKTASSWHLESPRTPLESLNNRGTYQYCHTSTGRRLFPRRRTITPIRTTPNKKAGPCHSPFEVCSSPIKAPQNENCQPSNNDSPSSTGSVKIGLLSTLDLPPLEAETGPVPGCQGMESCEPIATLEPDQASLLPTGHRSPTAIVVKSMKQPPRTESLSVHKSHLHSPRNIGDNNSGQGDELNQASPSVERKLETNCLVESTRSENHASEIEAQPASVPIAPSHTRDLVYVRDTVHPIDSWESSVKLCTTFLNNNDGRIQINHHARMTVVVPKQYIAAERTKLSITLSNGISGKHEMLLGPGQHSLFLQEDLSSADTASNKEGEIVIVRDTCDLDLPLNLYLTLTYRLPDPRFMVTSLPTFRPRKGETLSEVVALTHPSPPLAMKPLSRGDFTTWKEVIHSFAHATYFERVNMPRLYPEGFKDDIRIKIWTPSPVFFNCLDTLQPCDLVRNFDMTVEKVIGGTIECDMSFILHVNEADRLVSIDPHGWAPKYFAIDGRLATEQAGEWRENEKGLLTLFRRSGMARGPIQLEMHWQEPNDIASSNHSNTLDLPLPRVTDLKVVGGGLTCRLDKSKEPGDPQIYMCTENCTELLVLGHSGANSGSHSFLSRPYARLPPMFPGYKLYLTPTSDDHLHQPNPVTEKDHPLEPGSKELGTNPGLSHDRDCQEAPSLEDGVNLRSLTGRHPIPPIAEEYDLVELQSRHSGSGPERGEDAQSQRASCDEPNKSPEPAGSSLDSLLAIFLMFCLILCVHFYVHPLYMNGLQRDFSTQEHLGHGEVQALGCYEAGNDSLSEAYVDVDGTKTQNSQNGSDVKDLDTPHKDEAERARWEVVRDWLDHVLDGRQSQGYT